MKQYVTAQEYKALGGALSIDDTSLESWLQLATIKVDEMTFRRIGDVLLALTPFQQELVKRATVAQADHLQQLDETVGLDFDVSGWSITDVSMSYGGEGASPAKSWHKEQNHSSVALAYLNQSGLTWRGV